MSSHYYIERFISVGIYALLSLCLMNCIGHRQGKVKVNMYLRIYTILVSALAYFFVPAETMDLYRLWITASQYNKLPFGVMVDSLINSRWTSPFSLIYVCTICRINPHLLPAVTVFLFYSNISYIIADYYKKHDIKKNVAAVIVFLFLSRGVYGEVVSGIRSMLAFSFVAKCIYNEIYNKRELWLNVPFYVVATLLHSSSIAAIAIWLVVKVITGESGVKRLAHLLMACIFVVFFYRFAGKLVFSALESASVYLDSGGYFYEWEYIFNTLYLLLIIYIVYFKVSKSILSSEGVALRKTIALFALVCMANISVYSIYHRFISFITMFSIPLLLECVSKKVDEENMDMLVSNILIIAILFLFFSGLKGNLNGIRFFTL